MFQEYSSLSDEELDAKMEEINKRMLAAHSMGLDHIVEQMQGIKELLQLELTERLDKLRFDMINEKTPDTLVIGEDDGDEPSSTGDR